MRPVRLDPAAQIDLERKSHNERLAARRSESSIPENRDRRSGGADYGGQRHHLVDKGVSLSLTINSAIHLIRGILMECWQ